MGPAGSLDLKPEVLGSLDLKPEVLARRSRWEPFVPPGFMVPGN